MLRPDWRLVHENRENEISIEVPAPTFAKFRPDPTSDDAVNIWLETGDVRFSITEFTAKNNPGQSEATSIADISNTFAELKGSVRYDFWLLKSGMSGRDFHEL